MIPNTELENGKVELIREIKDIHDIDLVNEYSREINNSLNMQNTVNQDTEEVL